MAMATATGKAMVALRWSRTGKGTDQAMQITASLRVHVKRSGNSSPRRQPFFLQYNIAAIKSLEL
jgi:hypothetical protein